MELAPGAKVCSLPPEWLSNLSTFHSTSIKYVLFYLWTQSNLKYTSDQIVDSYILMPQVVPSSVQTNIL